MPTAANPIVAFDESGNTGQNLLDSDQPVFVLASVRAEADQIAEVKRIFGVPEDEEIHFVRLKRRKNFHSAVREFVELPWLRPSVAKVTVNHKRFMVMTKIVDDLVEPLVRAGGGDLYVRGRNVALANVWFHVIPAFCSPETLNDLLATFVGMMRDQSEEAIDAFYAAVVALEDACSHPPFQTDVAFLAATKLVVRESLVGDVTQLDPAVPTFVLAASRWDAELDSPFDIVHDESKPIAHMEKILACFMADDEPDVVVGYDRRKSRYPLRATGITLSTAAEHPELQVADVLAGVAGYYFRGAADRSLRDSLWEDLHQLLWEKVQPEGLWPSEDVTPEALGTTEVGGIDANEYTAELIRRQLSARS